MSAATLRRAHAVHPIVAVQSEYSLWSRNVEIGVLQACRDIGAALVAFSPTARAFLTGALRDVSTLDAKDIRRGMPRFYPDNYAANLKLLDGYAAHRAGRRLQHGPAVAGLGAVARRAGGGAARHHERGAPGRKPRRRRVVLAPATLQRLEALINRHTVSGARYNPATQAEVDTEEFG